MRSVRSWLLLAGALLGPFIAAGCMPYSMGIFTPVPVPPWVTERMEDKICWKNDFRTPVMPPIPAGFRPLCEDPPDRATILRTMPRVTRGIPFVYEEFRDDLDFVIEKLADHIDPPRFYPLVGPAQLHHCHWKCTVYYTETIQSSYPFPFKCQRRRAEVVYVDRDHLHLMACTPESQLNLTQEMTAVRP